MEILIGEYNKRSNALDIDIISLCGKLPQFKTHKSLIIKENKLKIHLEVFNKEILIKKGHKFIRDKKGIPRRAYKWTQNKYINNKGNLSQVQHCFFLTGA